MQDSIQSQPTIRSITWRKAGIFVWPMMLLGIGVWLLFHVLPHVSARPVPSESVKQTAVAETRLAGKGLKFNPVVARTTTNSGNEPFSLVWSSLESENTTSVAWGDYDGDGDLDLAVSNNGKPIRVYRNDNGVLASNAAWSSTEIGFSCLAWGDYDGDGNLDLAAGAWFGHVVLYHNSGNALTPQAVWSSAAISTTQSLAWGDSDGDGDLDLMVGNSNGGPNQLYRNDGTSGGVPQMTLVWVSNETDDTFSVAWSDYDRDGDLDLAVGNSNNQAIRLYRNNGVLNGVPQLERVWTAPLLEDSFSVAWGDYDGDGDPDLAVGNGSHWDNGCNCSVGEPNRLYRNDSVAGGMPQFTLVWSSAEADVTLDVAWGDYDGDGDLDLAAGNACLSSPPFTCYPNRLYRNDGVIGGVPQMNLVWSSTEGDMTSSVAWGDADGDGDLDLAAGTAGPDRVYRNESGTLATTAAWSSPVENTRSVAWGDVDGDGDLDLMMGDDTLANRLYRNDNGVLTAGWSSQEHDATFSIAWGDYDRDGNLDLAVGNIYQPNRLYHNDGSTLTAQAVYSTTEVAVTISTAWGDVDADGDLDLAVGNSDYYNYSCSCWVPGHVVLYRNDTGALTTSAVWTSVETGRTTSLAWGDYDNDGDLDLAVGSEGQPTRLYRNNSGTLTTSAVWKSTESDQTYSVAWGDYDGDGDLDLAVGNKGQPNRLYRNDHGHLTVSSTWSSLESDPTTVVAWGDVDGDGDLDLAVGNSGYPFQSNRLYRNEGGTLTNHSVWSPEDIGDTTSLAWGDVDGDGDLDLAVGNFTKANRLYLNTRDGRTLPGSIPVVRVARPGPNADFYSTPEIKTGPIIPITYTLSDPQGDPVKLVRAFYSLNGGGHWSPAVAARNTITSNLVTTATYVYNWDVLGSGFFGQSDNVVLRLMAVPSITHKANQTPGPYLYGAYASQTFPFRVRGTQVQVLSGTQPISNALVYRLPAGQSGSGEVMADAAGIPFRTDPQGYLQGRGQIQLGDQLLALAPVHSAIHYAGALTFDGSDDYVNVLTPTVPITNAAYTLAAWVKPDTMGARGIVGWGNYGATNQVNVLRLTDNGLVNDWGDNDLSATTGPLTDTWHHVAATFNGLTRTIYLDGVAVGNDTPIGHAVPDSRNFRIGSTNNAAYFDGEIDDVLIYTRALSAAEIQADMLQSPSGSEAGLVLDWTFDAPIGDTVDDQSGFGNAGTLIGATWDGQSFGGYTVYQTNGVPTENGLNTYTVTQAGVQTLTVTAAHPLILFDLDVSLEWDAHNDPSYLPQLTADLQRASAYLYDFSDGQVALGHVQVHQNADDWLTSQVVINATNRLRPLAVQGGSVAAPITDPQHSNIVYSPGQVRMGATWNRYGEPGGTTGSDWPLALAHELSHYLLFQEDTYLGVDNQGLLIPVGACSGSVMGDMYDPSNTEFVFDETHWNNNCADTLANRTLGRTEWATNRLWYPALVTPTITNPGPALMPFDLTTVMILDPITPTNALADPTFFIRYQAAAISSSEARAFLLRTEAAGQTTVIDVGSPLGGQNRVLARGAQPGDRLCVFDQPRRQYGCEVIQAGDYELDLEHDETWTPVIQISPVNSQTIAIAIDGLTSTLPLRARLYPADGYGGEIITLTQSNNLYTGTFHLDFPAMMGYVQVWVDETDTEANPRREAMVTYSLGGNPGNWPGFRGGWPGFRGGWPGFRGGWPGFRGGWTAARSSSAPLTSPGGQMLFFTPDPTSIQEGNLYTIQSMAGLPPLPNGKIAVGQGYSLIASPNVTQVITGSISFQYMSIDVLVEQADENQLTIHYWDGQTWQALDTTRSPYFNMASAPSHGPGIYALLAGVTIPHLDAIDPPAAINDVTTTLTVSGQDFLPPIDVRLIGPTTTYTLPVVSASPISITAIITPGLPAHEYQVMVVNHFDAPASASLPFALYDPAAACFYDFFESGVSKWQRSGTWDIITLPTGNQALTDSPGGSYSVTVSPTLTATTGITSSAFNLGSCPNPVLTFRHDYVIDNRPPSQDWGRVEISTDNGVTWHELARYAGGLQASLRKLDADSEWADAQWKDVEIDLSAYTGTVRLRFGLEFDRVGADRGWVIDNVRVYSKPRSNKVFLPVILKG